MSSSALIAPAAKGEAATLFVGFELSKSTWLMGLYAPELGKFISRRKVDGRDANAALKLIAVASRRLKRLGKPVRVVSVYEAGYDGSAEQAALVVMGAYGNSRLRQWIFGGFT
jgi:nucleotide-binding universal stress UspA family protein